MATKTHKDRVHEFNEKLEQLSEHHDIPKVRNVPCGYYDTSPIKYLVYRSDQGDNGHPPSVLFCDFFAVYVCFFWTGSPRSPSESIITHL